MHKQQVLEIYIMQALKVVVTFQHAESKSRIAFDVHRSVHRNIFL